MKNNLRLAFWGTGELAARVLEILLNNDFIPALVITSPDKPKGRGLELQPSPVKLLAQARSLRVDQPEKLKEYMPEGDWDLFIVAEYGKIIPQRLIDLPKRKTINVHPSLLPKFRGPSPIQSFMLSSETETGVSIMLIDAEMDHGPVLESRKLKVESKKVFNKEMEKELAELGGQMLLEVIPQWLEGKITPQEQDHSQATYCRKVTKEMGLVDLEKDSPEEIYKKVLALTPWPSAYFFVDSHGAKMRIIITDADFKDGRLWINKIKPEGKKEMPPNDFLRGNPDLEKFLGKIISS